MTIAVDKPDVPYFDIGDPRFSVSAKEVLTAREHSWFARTPFGLAVLRYEDVSTLLKDRRLRQGSFAWPLARFPAHAECVGLLAVDIGRAVSLPGADRPGPQVIAG